MSNLLKMAIIQSIQALRQQGWSRRRIARELGIHRETVARYVRALETGSKPAKAPTGSELPEAAPKPAKAPTGSDGPARPAVECRSQCEPFRATIEQKLQLGLSAQRIYQDIRAEHAFGGSYYSVCRFVRRLRPAHDLPFRRLESEPGQEAQIDFGKGAWIVQDGKRFRPHLFRLVLSHSRKAYSEVSRRQTTEDLIRCLENAFWYLGGVPRVIVIDNLGAAVHHPDWFDPELNPKLQSFCQHYGTVLLPTKPRTPRHKGKIERGVGYAQSNALKARTFSSIEQQNQFLEEWERSIADTRIHGTTRKQVAQLFSAVERPALLPLPAERFPLFQEAKRVVHRDGHVELGRAYYSVPPEYLAREVWVRWDSRLVRIFNARFEQIALHVRQQPGKFSTRTEHLAHQKISRVERGAEWLLEKVSRIGHHTARWARAMLEARGVEGVRVLVGLLSMAKRHDAQAIERACEVALSHGAFRLRTLRRLASAQGAKELQKQPFLLDEHPIIRPLSAYAVRFGILPPEDAAPPQGFFRHDEDIRWAASDNNAAPDRSDDGQGPGTPPSAYPRPGYPSSGCSPAEPDSVSPDATSLLHVLSLTQEKSSCERVSNGH